MGAQTVSVAPQGVRAAPVAHFLASRGVELARPVPGAVAQRAPVNLMGAADHHPASGSNVRAAQPAPAAIDVGAVMGQVSRAAAQPNAPAGAAEAAWGPYGSHSGQVERRGVTHAIPGGNLVGGPHAAPTVHQPPQPTTIAADPRLEPTLRLARESDLGTPIRKALDIIMPLFADVGESLTHRPRNLEDPRGEVLFREARSCASSRRRYGRNLPKPLDVWKAHGGTSVTKMELPAEWRLQSASSELGLMRQELIRRTGKIERPDGLQDLRYHQYEVRLLGGQGTVLSCVFHVLPAALRGRWPAAAAAPKHPQQEGLVGRQLPRAGRTSIGGSSEDDLTDVEGPDGWRAQRCDSTTDEDSSSSQHSPQGLPQAGASADFGGLDFLSLDALPAAPDDAALAAPHAMVGTMQGDGSRGAPAKRPAQGEGAQDADGAGPEPKRIRNIVMAAGMVCTALANTVSVASDGPEGAPHRLLTSINASVAEESLLYPLQDLRFLGLVRLPLRGRISFPRKP